MASVGSLLQPILESPVVRAVAAGLAKSPAKISLSGLTRPAKALVIAGLARAVQRPLLVLTANHDTAVVLLQATATFYQWMQPDETQAVSVLPGFDCAPYDGRSPHPEISEQRAVTLWNLACGRTRVLLTPLSAALGRFRSKAFYRGLAVNLQSGDEIDMRDLVEHLRRVGYDIAEPVENVGQYSVRGGIVDVYSPQSELPYRIEFLGDTVESLRQFDPTTQRSRKPVSRAVLLPLNEAPRAPQLFATLIQVLAARAPRPRTMTVEPTWAPEYSAVFPGWEFYLPLVEPHPESLFSLLEQPLVVWDEPAELEQILARSYQVWTAGYEEVRDVVPPRPNPAEFFLSEQEFHQALAELPQLSLEELSVEGLAETAATAWPTESGGPRGRVLSETSRLVFRSRPSAQHHGNIKSFVEDLRSYLHSGHRVVVLVPTGGKADRLREILQEYNLPYGQPAESTGTSVADVTASVVWIVRGEISEGFVLPDERLVFLSDRDLFGEFVWGSTGHREKGLTTRFLSDLRDLKVGDLVVHVDHGIGMYQGLRPLEVDGVRRDFMLLTYQDEAKLYVPLERLDLVEKYRTGEGARPALDRLGGTAWVRTKTRVQRALRDMAQELLQMYAERKLLGGIPCGPDTPWQKEFEETFEFEETPDQLSAIAEIKKDLETPQPMDRLLCGDVGYGKTELAMRAAFKVVQESRQVAVLAPTTVLAFQHYTTFRQRFAAFPLRIEMLSRFRSAAEQKQIVAETEAGRVDILIGTHRLLSKDISFRDLGLLVIDEEQRFGVAAKEKLKKWRANVDVLTMSATPIPRTLHMALGGLRDLSVIETPPQGRLAIQTVVAPFNQALIQAAIAQERERQGQVFFVHNRVESIWSVAALVQRLAPTARIGVAHGQMGERELEKVMLEFMRGEYDVLVSTSLIENGLDIPRANTIIVNRADRFGLADLYQLRGRVGRSNRRAYAYFLVPTQESLTPTARRRLAALKEFSDLGAGFRLAALDLELRGAGNVLGAEQHGHLNAIGLDLYLKMLEQTVEELKGAPRKPEVRCLLNLGLDIRIPEDYIADESQRLRTYKRIAGLRNCEQQADLEAELQDRFGPLPPSVLNLFRYAVLKSEAEQLFVQSIERKGDEVWFRFHEETPVNPQKLTAMVKAQKDASLRPNGVLRLHLRPPVPDLFATVRNVLQELQA